QIESRRMFDELWSMVREGTWRLPIASMHALDEFGDALEARRRRRTKGKGYSRVTVAMALDCVLTAGQRLRHRRYAATSALVLGASAPSPGRKETGGYAEKSRVVQKRLHRATLNAPQTQMVRESTRIHR